MKKIDLFASYMFIFVSLFLAINGCKDHTDERAYLKNMIEHLSQIQTATYTSISAAYTTYDTVPVYINTHSYKEFVTPSDTFVGASYVRFREEDAARMDFSYDGKMRMLINEDQKGLVIDSFKTSPGPFRVVQAPFFTRAKTILTYVLTTKDSLSMEMREFTDSIHYRFSIYDTLVEFIGNRVIYPSSPDGSHKGEVSTYELWIHKSDGLPYRLIRDMSNGKSMEECRNVELNTLKIKDFNAADYFPSGYTVSTYRTGRKPLKNALVGKIAPQWILKDGDNNLIALKDLKSKLLLLHFTGIGCGPCQASIPFLKELVGEYKNKDFELVSIETWNSNSHVLKRYATKNELNYKFLLSTKEITQYYQVEFVPVILLLDENRVIQKVFDGYSKGETDKQIREAIKELL